MYRKKTVAKMVFIMLTIVLCVCLVGCGNKTVTVNEDGVVQSNKPQMAAENFIKNLLDGDFESIPMNSNIEDITFITGNDIEWYLSRSSYSEIEDINSYEEVKSEVDKNKNGKASVTVEVVIDEDNSTEFYVDLVQNDDDSNWVVDLEGFYNTDWYLTVTGGDTQLYINDIEVDKKYITGQAGEYNKFDVYTIPCVGKGETTATIKSDSFEDYSVTELPTTNPDEDDHIMLIAPVADTDKEEIFKVIQTIWNDSYNDYVAEKSNTEALQYFVSDADTSVANDLWNYYEEIRKSSTKSLPYTDHKFVDIGDYKDSNSYYITDSIIFIDFGYKLEWEWKLTGLESMTYLSDIILEKEKGEYKIYKITDSDLFAMCNDFYNEWE